ncbi:hypothetical protein EDB80DRAFT_838775 [Ilyonectria destructans]|nr:hypothetical protein EDB80DRAFT_838775 [Ilyonectria destructans]
MLDAISAAGAAPTCSPSTFTVANVFGSDILSVSANLVSNYTATAPYQTTVHHPTIEVRDAEFCNVTVAYTHPGQNDHMNVEIWLPIGNWNERLMAVDGGGAYDGIATSAPALNWPQIFPSFYWPQLIMNELEKYPAPCEFDYLAKAAVKACDGRDGVVDEAISNMDDCDFNLFDSVGNMFNFSDTGKATRLSGAAAIVANATWSGAQSFDDRGQGLLLPSAAMMFVEKNKTFDYTTISRRDFDRIFHASVAQYTSMLGHQYRQVSENLYEQVIVRDPELRLYQGIFETFPDLTEWPMKDLYSKHPTTEGLWLYRGRADEIMVFSTGEKLNPLEMETIISSSPVVSAALVTGAGRFQSSLLVEAIKPYTNEAEKTELLDTIWKSVQIANKESPSHGRIHRDMMTLTTAKKPMMRAGKGTVQLHSVPDTIKHIVTAVTGIEFNSRIAEADFFELGTDSLQVTLIARQINQFLSARGRPQSLDVRTVYRNSSVAALTALVSALSEGKRPTDSDESGEQKMQRLYDHYSANMPVSMRQTTAKAFI